MNIPDLASVTEKRDAAYEIKFVLPSTLAAAALDWARIHLSPDPHAEVGQGDGYHVNSLYFDTPKLDVYHRKGSYGKAKYRIRRYGSEQSIFLERKLKSRGLVSKRRTRVPDWELPRLALPELEPEWVGYWFRRRLSARQLLPQCQIRYERVARLGMSPTGVIRFTIDRNVRGFRSDEYNVHDSGEWIPLLPDRCILELKFRQEMPHLFKSFIEQLALTPQPVSKYRLSIQAFGLDPEATSSEAPPRNGHVSPEMPANQSASFSMEMNGTQRDV